MKKVLIIGQSSPIEGGSQRHIYEISSRLGCDVLTQKGSICKNKIELPELNFNNYIRNITFAISCYIYSIYLLLIKKYDIIHIHENLLYFLAPILRLRYKVIITIHGISGIKMYDNKFLWFFFKSALKFANSLICISSQDKKILDSEFDDITYIPNGADISLYNKINPKIEKKIVYIGRIDYQKGTSVLLKAFERIKNKIPDFKLEILGTLDNYALSLKKQFPDKRIIWKGHVSDRTEIIKSLKSAYCIVLPSIFGEGLPLTLLEDLASSRPLILSSLASLKSVVNEEGIFFKPGNDKELAEKILFLIKNKTLANSLGKKGFNLAKNYDWDILAKQLNRLYDNL